MKILVILGILFAYAQATSEPITAQQLAARALNKCVQEKSLDENKIKEIFKNDVLPEDDSEFADFFVCYWKKALVIREDGSFDHLHIKVTFPHIIKDKYTSISESDAYEIAADAVKSCKDTPQADSIGLKGIQYRNCLTQFVKNTQE